MQCHLEHQWTTCSNNIKSGEWCPYCSHTCQIKAEERFEEAVASKDGIILSEYINREKYVSIQCSRGHISYMSPGNVTNFGFKCMTCEWENLTIEFENVIAHRKGKILELYQNTVIKILIECEFGHRWKVKPGGVRGGKWCPKCNESSLEREARLFLQQNNISFMHQYVAPELPAKRIFILSIIIVNFYLKSMENNILSLCLYFIFLLIILIINKILIYLNLK